MMKLVECVANFSEGRRGLVLDAIEAAIESAAGVRLLDRSSDPDHNRSVFTFAGVPEAVMEAAFRAVAKAADLIDLNQHQGQHPRIGAADVVPLVPLAGVTMADCAELARRLGQRVGDELGIPVYLYEAAATRPERARLENIRRGGYEGLREAIRVDPTRAPDFGPAQLGAAGATVIGARAPLIAYNVYLATDDVSIAQKVAHAIRHSSGGLPQVKALGLLVGGRAQVSMNLTDYKQTPLTRVMDAIRDEAAHHGVGIHHSEVVGLIPQAALADVAQASLQLEVFTPDQILETRLAAAFADQERQTASFLEQLAAATATPGGGAAAAYAGAMGAALTAMAARLTLGKPKYALVAGRMAEIAVAADDLRLALEQAVTRDMQAYEAVMAAYRSPKTTEAEQAAREQAIEQALQQAAESPLNMMRLAVKALQLAAEVTEQGNINAITDAATGGTMARASLDAAIMAVKANAALTRDRAAAEKWLEVLAALDPPARMAEGRIRQALAGRATLNL